METTHQDIYDKYIEKLVKEAAEEKNKINEIFNEFKDSDRNVLDIIKEQLSKDSVPFTKKYMWTGCSALLGNQAFFIKSAQETAKLCNELIDYPSQLIQNR